MEAPASSHVPADAPQIGVSFTGTRRDVLLADVIAIHGAAIPGRRGFAEGPPAGVRLHHDGRPNAASDQVSKLDNIRRQWESFFMVATSGRMTAITTLH